MIYRTCLPLAGIAAAILFALPALAQERSPAARQGLTDLARVLGSSHALRQACLDRKDQSWRTRMQQLLDVEAPDQGLKRRLMQAFNAGYDAEQAVYPACSSAAEAESARLAQHGRALAQQLEGP